MKYYYLKGALLAELTDGFCIECKLIKVKIGKTHLKRLTADFFFLKSLQPIDPDISLFLIPFSEQQALNYYHRMRIHDAIYRNSCEILWRIPNSKKRKISDAETLQRVLITMLERYLDIYASNRLPFFHWRKKSFEFTLS